MATAEDLDDLLDAPTDLRDPEWEPVGVVCSCGAVLRWTWWGGRGPIPGRWCRPASDPCDRCRARREADEAREEVRRRVGKRGAQLPRRCQRHTWARTVHQRADEDLGAWVRHVLSLEAPTIGIGHGLAEEARTISSWVPSDGGLYVHGPVGTGKSLWVGARLRDLLAETTTAERVELSLSDLVDRGLSVDRAQAYIDAGRHVAIRPGGLYQRALWIDEAELVERVSLGWSGDRDPLKRVSETPLLVLDDLGSQAMTHREGKRAQLVRDSVARLVSYRWEHDLTTVYTSNLPPPALRDVYGERTADRLAQAVSTVVQLPGLGMDTSGAAYSWRKPPPVKPWERPERDRKTQAAEPEQHREPVQGRLM
jgi:DNA replication protein DnaC